MYSFHFSVALKFSSGLVFFWSWLIWNWCALVRSLPILFTVSVQFFFFFLLLFDRNSFRVFHIFFRNSLRIRFNFAFYSICNCFISHILNIHTESKTIYYLKTLQIVLIHYIVSAHLFVSFPIECTFHSFI